jgi:hypothetical protein
MSRQPLSVSVTLGLILVNAAFWLVFAILVAAGAIGSIPAGIIRWVMAVLALGCSGVLAGLAILLRWRNRLAFCFGVALMAVVALLSIADDFGLPDLATLLISLISFGLLLKDRAWYLRRCDDPPKEGVPAASLTEKVR